MLGARPRGGICDKTWQVETKYCYISVSAYNDKADVSYSCTYISMHMPVKDKIILNKIST